MWIKIWHWTRRIQLPGYLDWKNNQPFICPCITSKSESGKELCIWILFVKKWKFHLNVNLNLILNKGDPVQEWKNNQPFILLWHYKWKWEWTRSRNMNCTCEKVKVLVKLEAKSDMHYKWKWCFKRQLKWSKEISYKWGKICNQIGAYLCKYTFFLLHSWLCKLEPVSLLLYYMWIAPLKHFAYWFSFEPLKLFTMDICAANKI